MKPPREEIYSIFQAVRSMTNAEGQDRPSGLSMDSDHCYSLLGPLPHSG